MMIAVQMPWVTYCDLSKSKEYGVSKRPSRE